MAATVWPSVSSTLVIHPGLAVGRGVVRPGHHARLRHDERQDKSKRAHHRDRRRSFFSTVPLLGSPVWSGTITKPARVNAAIMSRANASGLPRAYPSIARRIMRSTSLDVVAMNTTAFR